VLMDSLVLFYTFFIHTELVGKLGWIEKFMNTPSHHRVHHASNPKYIDKNYGAVLIIWDKLFGTFVEEEERPTYGLTKPIKTNNAIKIVFKEWVAMFKDASSASTLGTFFKYLLYPPGWTSVNAAPLRKIRINSFSLIAKAVAIVCLIFAPLLSLSQQVETLLKEAEDLEKVFNDDNALTKYEEVLAIEPNNRVALVHGSRMLCNTGGRSKDKSIKKSRAERAMSYALKAIRLDNNDKEAHLNYILSLGILSEMADSPREKLSNAKIIRKEVDFLLKIDPDYAPAYYILGKWNFALASLSGFEIFVCKVLFGGVPEGASMKQALLCYDKALEQWPDYILFHYSKGLVYHKLGDRANTIASLKRALNIKPVEPDDFGRIEKCKTLLNQVLENT